MNQEKLLENWQIKKLSEVCKIIMGQSPPSDTYSDQKIGLPFFQGKAEFTDLYPIPRKYCSKPTKIAEPFDILLSVRAPVGTTNIANQKCCIGRGLAALRFENYKYGFYFLRSIQYELDSKGTGTTFRAISGEVIRETLIPYPNLDTQNQIVSKIEELFSDIDKGIEDLKIAQQQLKTYRQSVLKWAFEGKLTNENVREGELQKGWENKTLGEIFKVSSGKGIKINQLKGGDYSVYGGNGLNGYHSEYFLDEPVLIIGRVGVKCGVTHITKSKSWVSDNALIVKPIIQNFYIKFFKLRLEFENLNKLSVSTAQPVISGNSIYSVCLFLPTLEEQHLIVQEIESRLSVADKMEESINESLKQAEALRQSILKKAFSGELI